MGSDEQADRVDSSNSAQRDGVAAVAIAIVAVIFIALVVVMLVS